VQSAADSAVCVWLGAQAEGVQAAQVEQSVRLVARRQYGSGGAFGQLFETSVQRFQESDSASILRL